MSETAQRNCIDIVKPVISELSTLGLLDGFQLMGGIGSAALKHKETVIFPDERRVVTAPSFLIDNPDIARYRPEGTLRDLDAVVLTSQPSRVNAVEAVAKHEVKDALEVSVFGLRKAEHLRHQAEHPFGIKALKTFVSERYEDEAGNLIKALFPFAVPLPAEALEPWTAEIDGHEFPIMNPAGAVVNYLTRSISGLRPKDAQKVQSVMAHVAKVWPESVEWIVDGPGRSQMELASILQTLRRSNSWPHSKRHLQIGGVLRVPGGKLRDLHEDPGFMLHDKNETVQEAAIALATLKARGLGMFESSPWIVKLYQQFVERHMGTITKNT